MNPLKVPKHFPDEQIEVDALAELPEKGGQEEVVEEGSPCRAQLVWTGDSRAVDTHQEHELGKPQCQRQLSVDLVERLVLESVGNTISIDQLDGWQSMVEESIKESITIVKESIKGSIKMVKESIIKKG